MVRGDAMVALREIGRLEKTLEKLAELPRKLAASAAPEINGLLQRQFTRGEDPYGTPWRPLRKATLAKGRHNPPLTDTGALRSGTRVYLMRARYAGLRIVVGADYGYFHQVGFRVGRTKVAPRRILPDRGIPASWKVALDRAARRLAREAVAA
jgi:hypothetical protein